MTDQQLKVGYWYVTHKQQMRQLLVAVLILLNVGVWGYGIYGWVTYLTQTERHEAMMRDFLNPYIDYAAFKERDAPRNFQILGSGVFPIGDNRYDIMVKIRNPNPQWMALVEYQFMVNNPKVVMRSYRDFVLPGDDKYLLDLGVSSESALGAPKLNILSLKWQRVDNFKAKKEQRLQITISDTEFLASRTLGLAERLEINRARFTARNASPYNFWKTGFVIVLFSGTKPVGVNYLLIDSFSSSEIRDLEVSWFNALPSVTKVEVKPDLNIMDSANYKEFKGVVSPDVRDYGNYRRR